jgi:hypothetical protein
MGVALVELVDVVVERAIEAKVAHLSKWGCCVKGSEADVGMLCKTCPYQGALVSFWAVVPLLCGTLHVERSQPYLFGLGCTGGSEELLATTEPW